jgi:anaerobic selenocysteine-containing dehydrogenase
MMPDDAIDREKTGLLSRRGFLKGTGLAAAGLAVSPLSLPQAAQAATGQELCTVLDLSRCIGCEACV